MPIENTTSPGQEWLNAAKKKLGNCGTEITLTAPNELTLLRNAPIGFTGFELNLLEFWLECARFSSECPPRAAGASGVSQTPSASTKISPC